MNRLATAMLVLAIVAGPPLLAGVWLLHHPWQPPTRAQTMAWAEQPLTTGTIIGGCLAITCLAWLLLLIYLTRRALTEVRRRLQRMRHLPVPTPAQMTASSMAGLAAFALPTAPAEQPQPSPAVPGTPQLPDSVDIGYHENRSALSQPAGIALPGGGWIPYRTALAITALAAAAWLQRRRLYQPDPHQPRDHHDDPDLQPLPKVVDTVIAAVTDDETTERDQALPPSLLQSLPAGVLLLTGPGAAAAARGLLVTAACSDTTTVSIRPHDLQTLIPADHPVSSAVVPPDVETAEDFPSTTSTVIALSDEPGATHHWHITADGTASGTGLTEPRWLCTLDARTATDLLTFIGPRSALTTPEDRQPLPMSGWVTTPVPKPAAAGEAYLTLLGGCHLAVKGQPIHPRRNAGLQILAYLAAHPQGATRKELTLAIWPHLPPATISQRFHTTLTDLRRQLRPLLDDDPIARKDDHYQLNANAIATDLQYWHAAAYAMTHALGTSAQLHACREVVDQYRGDLAAGHTWPWLIPAREHARRTVMDACSVLTEHASPEEALNWLERAITIDPHNEPMHRQAADLLRAAGDETGAADLLKRFDLRLMTGKHPSP